MLTSSTRCSRKTISRRALSPFTTAITTTTLFGSTNDPHLHAVRHGPALFLPSHRPECCRGGGRLGHPLAIGVRRKRRRRHRLRREPFLRETRLDSERGVRGHLRRG